MITVALDANVLINFLSVQRLDLLECLPGFRFVVPMQVVQEVCHPDFPDQTALLRASLAAGRLREETSASAAKSSYFAEFCQVMDLGEAACLALAEARGWHVASDEKGIFMGIAQKRLGENRILNTPGIMLLAIKAGLLQVQEADALKARWEPQRFKAAFASFADALSGLETQER